jgi:hypothetical protein
MFDPTAFENMKVVLEGAVYDRDLSGEILVIDRNDLINTAKLSRRYEIQFRLNRQKDNTNTCTIMLHAGLEHMAAELLPSALNDRLVGCMLQIRFSAQHVNNKQVIEKLRDTVDEIWQGRSIQQTITFNPMKPSDLVTSELTVDFNRLILEEQIDDLVDMVDYMLKTLARIPAII